MSYGVKSLPNLKEAKNSEQDVGFQDWCDLNMLPARREMGVEQAMLELYWQKERIKKDFTSNLAIPEPVSLLGRRGYWRCSLWLALEGRTVRIETSWRIGFSFKALVKRVENEVVCFHKMGITFSHYDPIWKIVTKAVLVRCGAYYRGLGRTTDIVL